MGRRTRWVRDTDTLMECSICRELKPHSEFRPYSDGRPYRHRHCNPCMKAREREARQRNGPRFHDTATHRECGRCRELKPTAEFETRTTGNLQRACRQCLAVRAKAFRDDPDNREFLKEKKRQYRSTEKAILAHRRYEKGRWHKMKPASRAKKIASVNRRRKQYRIAAVMKYGGRCNCCGESLIEFLCVDHVHNDGKVDRQTRQNNELIVWMIRNPVDPRYQVLCYNCNMGKVINKGICPHQREVLRLVYDADRKESK